MSTSIERNKLYMKKFITLVIAIILSNCEIEVKPRQVHAQNVYASGLQYAYTEKVVEGMKYGIWCADYRNGVAPAVCVVNLTKDKLEVEFLKKQLQEK